MKTALAKDCGWRYANQQIASMKIPIIIAFAATLFGGSAFAAPPAKAPPTSQNKTVQPFTYANVVKHFKGTGLRVTEVQKRCTIFFEGEFKEANIYNYCVVMVENSDEDLQVTFYLTDAHEMNWVTEFLDAPFFSKAETEKLFGLVNAHRGVRGQQVGRFRVDFNHWSPKHAEIVVFSFSPAR